MHWRCMFRHTWSAPHNYRPNAFALTISLFVRVNVEVPYLFDQTCVLCGKTRTVECAKPKAAKQ